MIIYEGKEKIPYDHIWWKKGKYHIDVYVKEKKKILYDSICERIAKRIYYMFAYRSVYNNK